MWPSLFISEPLPALHAAGGGSPLSRAFVLGAVRGNPKGLSSWVYDVSWTTPPKGLCGRSATMPFALGFLRSLTSSPSLLWMGSPVYPAPSPSPWTRDSLRAVCVIVTSMITVGSPRRTWRVCSTLRRGPCRAIPVLTGELTVVPIAPGASLDALHGLDMQLTSV